MYDGYGDDVADGNDEDMCDGYGDDVADGNDDDDLDGGNDEDVEEDMTGVMCLFQQAEDDVELTPEQQRQLAMIDNMPLTIEKEITPEEWDLKTPEEKERIIGKSWC